MGGAENVKAPHECVCEKERKREKERERERERVLFAYCSTNVISFWCYLNIKTKIFD